MPILESTPSSTRPKSSSRPGLRPAYPDIGRRFGNRDHTTVMSARRKITGRVSGNDEPTERAIDAIERKLGLR